MVTAGRAASQSSSAASQTTQIAGAHSRPGTADLMRSRSETVVSRNSRRPRSRGSTASIHSTTTQQTQDQQLTDGFSQFLPAQTSAGSNVFGSNPEDIIMRFGQQLSHQVNGTSLDPTLPDAHHPVMGRADDFSNHTIHGHHLSHHSLPPGLPTHGLPGVAIPQYQNMYDSGIENHVPEHILDDHDASEAGGKKKKGSSSSIANDNELRKLLRQYEGYTLKQMAAEVLKHEGAGGKAEKVKQVFAMIWLKENCRKSSGSVRRDRVYCCYAEKCGTERVSVLNPASFGKLVRIIFPNVQTRRLGVRGESKYHYVDLTVIEEKQQKPTPQPAQFQPYEATTVGTTEGNNGDTTQQSVAVVSQPTADTALFPSPPTSFAPKVAAPTATFGCDCQSQAHADSDITLDNVANHSGKLIHRMLQLPTTDSSSVDTDSLQLPDINEFLPANTDSKVAAALAALYRSHCISVIDSFRYCKERNLLRYFSAFHGTLTVPVQKLLTHPNLAPWIKECDWLMYQKMIAFVAPLTTQVVPKLVLDAFSSISQRLTTHIADTFRTQPVHVSLARLIPAHIFCNLLRHMLDVNQSANAAAAWLCHPDNRNQMWLDFKALVDPKEMITKANIPSCAERATEQILKHDVYALLTPVADLNPADSNEPFSQSDAEEDTPPRKFPVAVSVGDEYNFPDKWISFILKIPHIFPQHRTQCLIQRVDALWDCILRRLTLGGAQSFSAWWMTKVFFHEMMLWQAEKGGFMRYTPNTLQTAGLDLDRTGPGSFLLKPSSDATAAGSEPSSASDAQNGVSQDRSQMEVETNLCHAENEKSVNMSENLTSFHTPNHDDSAIGLDDDSMLMNVGKYGDMMVSDPADAEGDVVVI
ncbi:RFX family transcription factor [Aspergillus lucknowensis]|uniref:RFX-type winged-helix domain-containing protein n=1 Tax=Aspergillus lucknowensis TaxID=176173 RepID=A0ABR4LMC9_9EURO